MAYEDNKSSAQLQREVDQQRAQLEDRIDGIQEKLSPGQLIDELMAYTKGGGGEFIASLQRNVTANPLPVALLGVSLAWLMAKPAPASNDVDSDRAWDDSINARRGYGGDFDDDDYPIATVAGSSMTRISHMPDESGRHFSEFADEAGKKYRAASDETGRRTGHFMDEPVRNSVDLPTALESRWSISGTKRATCWTKRAAGLCTAGSRLKT